MIRVLILYFYSFNNKTSDKFRISLYHPKNWKSWVISNYVFIYACLSENAPVAKQFFQCLLIT